VLDSSPVSAAVISRMIVLNDPGDKILVDIGRAVLALHYLANDLIAHNSPPEPSTIWHYTTADGLLGIVKNQQLYMSHILCMNDTEELEHGISHILQAIDIRGRAEISDDVRKFHTALKSNLTNSLIVSNVQDIFVSCFSGETDTLTHWLEYGRNGVGYAIGFDTIRLKAATGQHCSFRACVYDDRLKKRVALVTLESAEIELDKLIAAHGHISPEKIAEEFARIFAGIVAAYFGLIFKNSIFEPEREWRLLTILEGGLVSTFDSRANEIREIVKLPIHMSNANLSPIVEIKIGSNRDERLRDIGAAVITKLLSKEPQSNWKVKVSVSRSPYRSS